MKIRTNEIIEYSICFLFLISFIFSHYDFLGISFSYWILSTLCLFIIITKKKVSINFDKVYLFFIFSIILNQLLIIFVSSSNLDFIFKGIIEVILTSFFVILISNNVNLERLYKVYLIISIPLLIILFIQSYNVYVLGQSISRISIFPAYQSESIQWLKSIDRPMSIFIEPEAFSTFMLPLIIMTMFRKKYILFTILSVALILANSALGLILLLTLTLFYFYKEINIDFIKRNFTFIIIIIITFLISSNFFINSFNRLSSFDFSTFQRLINGFEIWKFMPLDDKILGIGRQPILSYLLQENIVTSIMKLTSESSRWVYFTSYAWSLIYYGIFVTFIYSFLLIRLIFKKSRKLFIIGIAIIMLSFSRTLLFNSWFVLWFVLYFIFLRKTGAKL